MERKVHVKILNAKKISPKYLQINFKKIEKWVLDRHNRFRGLFTEYYKTVVILG